MSFKRDVLKNIAIFSGKHLCWSLFFSDQKGTPTKVLTWEYCKIVGNSLFYRIPLVAASERFHYEYFSVKFPNSGKLYQQLELEYLNQRRWWDVYICFLILLNVQYIMLFKFNKNYFRQPDLTYLLPEKKFLKMLLSLALLIDGISLILTSGHTGKLEPRTISWDLEPRTMGKDRKIEPWGETLRWGPTVGL